MGTQQILLIVLSVIIVGVAIVVGIGMFNRQAYNSNQTAIASDAQTYASEVVQYYKTPISQGGAMDQTGISTSAWALTPIAARLGIGEDEDGAAPNENGKYWVDSVTNTQVVIKGIGTATRGGKNPMITTTITFPDGGISAQIGVYPPESGN